MPKIAIDRYRLARRINEIMIRSGLSNSEFAERVGIRRSNLSEWIGGSVMPSTANLLMIARIAGITIDELLEGTVKE